MKSKFEYIGGINVHGIWLESRHGRLNELREMLAFAEMAHARGLARYVAAIFYDSNGAEAMIKFHITPQVFDPVFNAVEAVARRTLRCFTLEGDDNDRCQWGRWHEPEGGAPIPPRWHEWARQ